MNRVAILMCTLNGQRFLAEQVVSFEAQDYRHWKVYVSDDGSVDDTLSMLSIYNKKCPKKFYIYHGPGNGFAENFLSLVLKDEVQADYYAFADQDDIWEPTKLSRAVSWLSTVPNSLPALYCSRTCLVDVNNKAIGYSPLVTQTISFQNALVQNIASGNTMVFNAAARLLLQEAGRKNATKCHDWLAYMVVTGCGGIVFYDPIPSVRYRQHGSNQIGMNYSWSARVMQAAHLFKGRFRQWITLNIQALEQIYARLTIKNQGIFVEFCEARKKPFLGRMLGFKRAGIYRQTSMDNIGLVMAELFNRV